MTMSSGRPEVPRPSARGDTRKQRALRVRGGATDADRAMACLHAIDGLAVRTGDAANVLLVDYDLRTHRLRAIEALLQAAGVKLESSTIWRVQRALIHFAEDTEVRNLRQPQRLLKKSSEVYVKAYEGHPHGDHDDTPPELREYR